MIRIKDILLSLALGLAFSLLAWQLAEHYLSDLFGSIGYKVFKTSYMELGTQDGEGLSMRYIPGLGKVYDAEYIARQASRGYDTRIDPERMKWFTQGSDWLLAKLDSTNVIMQPYDFPPADDQAPWQSASAQSATALAILKRAGHDRDKAMLARSISILEKLDPHQGKLSIAESDSSYWFVAHLAHPYSLYGQLCVLTDLQEFFRITGLPQAGSMYLKGMRSLVQHLPSLETNGYLNDKYLFWGRRTEHRKLYQLMNNLSAGYPDPDLASRIKGYHRRHGTFILMQMFANPSVGRIAGFIVVWLLIALIAYLFIRRPVKNFTSELG